MLSLSFEMQHNQHHPFKEVFNAALPDGHVLYQPLCRMTHVTGQAILYAEPGHQIIQMTGKYVQLQVHCT